MAKLKCIKPNVAGTQHQFPLIGHVSFDKDSVIVVDDKLVKEFLKIQCGFIFELVGNSKDEKVSMPDSEVPASTEKDIYLEGLESLTNEELNALLGVNDPKETKKLKSKKAKIDYLVSKQFA